MPTIRIEELSKFYTDKKERSALAALYRLNVQIPNGRFTVITGPSGCGKTTLLKCICGLESADEGRILFDRENVTALPPAGRNVSYLSQAFALYPHMTVFDNVAYPLKLAGVQPQEIRRRVRQILQQLQIEGLSSRLPRQLSGGQQQRVALARALVRQPEVLLLDEPLSNVDERLRRALMEEFLQVQKRLGITFVYVTHNLQEVWHLGDYLVVMDNGEVVESGEGRQIFLDPESWFSKNFGSRS